MVKRIILAILLLPAAEIAAFVLVATLIGLAGALLLMLATTFAGILVLRQAGRGGMARFRVAVADGDLAIDPALLNALFLGFMFAFAVKAPLWPLHSWLPDAAVAATPPF